MEKVFISYNHSDSRFVDKLVGDIQASFDIWLDKTKLLPNISLIQQIAANIESADYMIAVISKNSVKSAWVKTELSLGLQNALGKNVSVIPLKIDDCRIPPEIKSIPYVDFHNRRNYKKSLSNLINMIVRDPVVSGNVVLPLFIQWGGIRTRTDENGGLRVSSQSTAKGATGLLYDNPIFITGFSKLFLHVEGSGNSNFTGWSSTHPRMIKLELNGDPVLADRDTLRSPDDDTYVIPRDGTIEYTIPDEIREDGYIKKFEIVLGKGHISNLILKASFG